MMKIQMRTDVLIGMAASLLLLSPTLGRAAPLSYSFSGTVVTSADPAIAVGETYSGLLQYDPQATLTNIGGNFKQYSDPTLLAQFTFSGATLMFTGGSMQVTDPAPIAVFGIPIFDSVATTGTTADYGIVNFDFTAPAGTFAPNWDIPTDLTALTPINGSSRDSSFGTLLTFTVGNVAPVPEPATLSLLALGGPMLFRRHR